MMCCIAESEYLDYARYMSMRDNYHEIEEFNTYMSVIVRHVHRIVAHEFHGLDLELVDNYTFGASQSNYIGQTK